MAKERGFKNGKKAARTALQSPVKNLNHLSRAEASQVISWLHSHAPVPAVFRG